MTMSPIDGAADNEARTRENNLKYETRYASQRSRLRGAVLVLFVVVGTTSILDIIRLALRLDAYEAGNGNMLPQAVLCAMLACYALFFLLRQKKSVSVLMYITILSLFCLFSLAVIPSFVKEIVIDYDILCPVLIGATGLDFLTAAVNIYIAYKFLKFHIKYEKRKANLPAAVLTESLPQDFENQRGSLTLRLQFPPPSTFQPPHNPEHKTVEEQWEQFLRSRYQQTKENARALPMPQAPLPAQAPLQFNQFQQFTQDQWEQFQKSRLYLPESPPLQSAPQTPTTPLPIAQTGQQTTQQPTSTHPTQQRVSLQRYRTHTDEPPPVATQRPILGSAHASPVRDVGGGPLRRNPSFRYGAYLLEPKQFVAQISPCPAEYTPARHRSGSLPVFPKAETAYLLEQAHAEYGTDETQSETSQNPDTTVLAQPGQRRKASVSHSSFEQLYTLQSPEPAAHHSRPQECSDGEGSTAYTSFGGPPVDALHTTQPYGPAVQRSVPPQNPDNFGGDPSSYTSFGDRSPSPSKPADYTSD